MAQPLSGRTSLHQYTRGRGKQLQQLQQTQLRLVRLKRQKWQLLQFDACRAHFHLDSNHRRQSSVVCSGGPQQPHKHSELPEELQMARNARKIGLTASVGTLATAAAIALTSGIRPPEQLTDSIRPELLLWACGTVSGTVVCALLAAKLALGDQMHIEWHDGRLRLEYAVVNKSLRLPDAAILVKPTEDGRGNGAFAVKYIEKGTVIGDYEGEMLSEAAYWRRYPLGVSDYCIGVDTQWTIDGAARAANTAVFSACHMNHAASGAGANVSRHTLRKQGCVRFSAQQDIHVGEELLLDYGDTYWTGRKDQIIS